MTSIPNRNWLSARILLSELAAQGIKNVVLSPGSRSTPLAHTVSGMGEFNCTVITDERSAAFFALGQSKGRGLPSVLICTSGTASANYFPAVIEAFLSQIPLIILTADRPLDLRNSGSMQTIDQTRLFGNYVRYFAELPEANLNLERMRSIRARVSDAFLHSISTPKGPVHINIPFDEPLTPMEENAIQVENLWRTLEQEKPFHPSIFPSINFPSSEAIEKLNSLIDHSLCGLIVAGPQTAQTRAEANALHLLGKSLGWPILAEASSGLRFHSEPVFGFYNHYLRNENLSKLSADVILSFGKTPTSKVLEKYLQSQRSAVTVRIQPDALRNDPHSFASETIVSDLIPLCEALTKTPRAARDSLLYDPFQKANSSLSAKLQGQNLLAENECEAAYLLAAVQALPEDSNVFLANSLPIRYGEALLGCEGKSRHVFANRGASGIDGLISTAAGIAFSSKKITLLVIGDLAFLHDLTALKIAKEQSPNLKILLLNNNGGGIFHFLSIEKHGEPFEKTHGTPHNLILSEAGRLFQTDWQLIGSINDLAKNITKSLASDKIAVFEVKTDRRINHNAHTNWMDELAAVVS